jgi:hypothetical protein
MNLCGTGILQLSLEYRKSHRVIIALNQKTFSDFRKYKYKQDDLGRTNQVPAAISPREKRRAFFKRMSEAQHGLDAMVYR